MTIILPSFPRTSALSFTAPPHIAAAKISATPAPPPSPPASRPSRRCRSSGSGTPHGPRGGYAGGRVATGGGGGEGSEEKAAVWRGHAEGAKWGRGVFGWCWSLAKGCARARARVMQRFFGDSARGVSACRRRGRNPMRTRRFAGDTRKVDGGGGLTGVACRGGGGVLCKFGMMRCLLKRVCLGCVCVCVCV